MILNIIPIIQRIRETDFASASITKARAVYGILDVLKMWVEDGNNLIRLLLQRQPKNFLHNEQPIDGYEQSDVLWAALPLKERLLRLRVFYQKDIHQLSRGDDQKAHQLLATAEHTFEQCRKEVLEQCDSLIEEFLLYFHVLCLAHPGYRNPANVRLYIDYNRYFDALPMEQFDEDCDLAWQYREVRWRRYMLHEQHFDLSLLPLLTFADEEACRLFRLQCYKWMLDLDPEDDHTVQTQAQNDEFIAKGIRNLLAWLNSKYSNNIHLTTEVEATALLTIYCGMNAGSCDYQFIVDLEENVYGLLDRLQDSHFRTHLMAQVGYCNNNSDFIKIVNEDIASWDKSQLTQEDLYLVELQCM